MIRSQSENGIRRIAPTLRAARIGFLSLLPLIAIAALFGRKIERAYPVLIFVLPYSGFLFFVLHAAMLAFRCSRSPAPAERRARKWMIAACALACPVLFVLLSNAFIEMPIERIHLLKYGLLGYFLPFALNIQAPRRRIAVGFLLAALAGVTEETCQLWIPERRFDVRDILVNVLSVAIGAAYAALVTTADELASRNPRNF